MEWPLVGRETTLEHALELAKSGTGVAILGPAGVGKSRLLHELVARVNRTGITVINTFASTSTRSIPFAPFVELLPPDATPDRLTMLALARAALRERAGRGEVLLTVDDAHELDDASLAFLVSVVSAELATVVLTARTGEVMAPDLVGLWVNGLMKRIDVAPLDREASKSLVETTLGDVSADLEEELWRLGEGNPLVLHELIEGAVGHSLEKDHRGEWIYQGSIAKSSRLSDLVMARISHIDPELETAIDIVAVGAPLPLAVARAAVGDGLKALEATNLVSWSGPKNQRVLTAAHPLYGEILKENMGETRRRAASHRLATIAARNEASVEPLQAAIWQQDAGEIVSSTLAIAGAREALIRHDPTLAEQLLRPVVSTDIRAAILLGRALSYRQQFADAEEILGRVSATETDSLVELASIRAQNLGYGLGRVVEARQLLKDSADKVDDADLHARLLSERALISATVGDFTDAITLSEDLVADDRISDGSRSAAYVTLTVALTMTGDLDQMEALIDDARATAKRAREVQPLATDQIEVMYQNSQLSRGRIAEAVTLIRSTMETGTFARPMAGAWLAVAIMAYQTVGLLRQAESWARRALAVYDEGDPFGLEPQGRGLLASTRGQMGSTKTAESVDGLRIVAPSPRLGIWVNRGRAWTKVVQGDVDGAAEIAAEGGRQAIKGQHFIWGAFLFHDVVRFGRPDLVIDDLRAIDTSKGAVLAATFGEHAEALLAESPEELEAIGSRFAAMGSPLFAAEAYSQASAIYEWSGASRQATLASAVSMAWGSLCEEAKTPALMRRAAGLTFRELEVALDAADGRPSSEIAESRFISVRTVDNHLRSVYRKLGMAGRDDLTPLFADVLITRSAMDREGMLVHPE